MIINHNKVARHSHGDRPTDTTCLTVVTMNGAEDDNDNVNELMDVSITNGSQQNDTCTTQSNTPKDLETTQCSMINKTSQKITIMLVQGLMD